MRRRTEAALPAGGLTLPEGGTTRWQLRGATPGRLRDGESRLAGQLIGN